MKETIEQFLARGGVIERPPPRSDAPPVTEVTYRQLAAAMQAAKERAN